LPALTLSANFGFDADGNPGAERVLLARSHDSGSTTKRAHCTHTFSSISQSFRRHSKGRSAVKNAQLPPVIERFIAAVNKAVSRPFLDDAARLGCSVNRSNEKAPVTPAQQLRNLLSQPNLEIMPGCYDALSAKLVAGAGYKVTFMSGFAVSAARLGLPDTGLISFAEMLDSLRNCCSAASRIPLIGDGIHGPGNGTGTYANARPPRQGQPG
jgi:hypothetical protein